MLLFTDIEVLSKEDLKVSAWKEDSIVAFINTHWQEDRRAQVSIFATKQEWTDALHEAMAGFEEDHVWFYVRLGNATLQVKQEAFEYLAKTVKEVALAQVTVESV